jgi:hypothetical protein
MTLLRLFNPQGIAGLAASLCLVLLLVLQKGETRHWKKQSGQFEQLYRDEQIAFAGTVANYRAAAEQARLADKANVERVKAEQAAISERTSNDFEDRLAAARAAAANISFERLRTETRTAAADPGTRGAASVPGISAAAREPSETAREDRLSAADRLLATEQAIQLDELIKWIRAQAKVDNNASSVASPVDDKAR